MIFLIFNHTKYKRMYFLNLLQQSWDFFKNKNNVFAVKNIALTKIKKKHVDRKKLFYKKN
jgi:hypothetical protein